MRVIDVREVSVRLEGNVSNAVVSFAGHDVSLVALVSDEIRDGVPVVGLAFDSIGRFAQRGIIRDRLAPRLLAADPETLLALDGLFDPAAVARCTMKNEKPGGHGDRAAAGAAIELACWDLNAKLRGEPAFATIARSFGHTPNSRVSVYAAGGYYYPDDSIAELQDELRGYKRLGFDSFKIKIGGADIAVDQARIEAAIEIAGSGGRLCVDANARFDPFDARRYAKMLEQYALRWFEEPVDPSDFEGLKVVIECYHGAVATGENLFSLSEVTNLLRYGGMRSGTDIFQMDAGLSYGLTEYVKMLSALEQSGFSRAGAYPHGGHLINLHIGIALGLGGCEVYPGVFAPIGGFSPACALEDGFAHPSDAPGFGLEEKPELRRWIDELVA